MGNVLDDVTDDNIDVHHVLRRVDDWEARVKRLYTTVSEWRPEGWTARAGASVRNHEELMHRFDVDARQIPTLLLANGSGKSAVLEPRGLWIIGNQIAHGALRSERIDVSSVVREFYLIQSSLTRS